MIHTVGPIYRGGSAGEPELLRNAYWKSLQAAVDYGVKRIAFPSISTGAYGYPVEDAAKIALGTVQEFCEKHPGKIELVRFMMFGDRTKRAYESAQKNL